LSVMGLVIGVLVDYATVTFLGSLRIAAGLG